MAKPVKKPVAAAKNGAATPADGPTPFARLVLDRYLLGLWTDRDLELFLKSGEKKKLAPHELAFVTLAKVATLDRQKAARALRQEWLGVERPSPVEELEALVREGVDLAQGGKSVLKTLQTDLGAHRDVVGVDDPRAKAAQILSKLAAAQQMHVSIQLIGNAAEKSLDRVDKARAVALAELTEALAELPHLAPSKQG